MKANEMFFTEFLKQDTRFVIPIYQRHYSWMPENCRTLWDDLLDMINTGRTSHYFGTVVSFSPIDSEEQETIIIDGQQRVTTVMLLLMALMDFKPTPEDDIDDTYIDRSKVEIYLGPEKDGERKIKLVMSKDDHLQENGQPPRDDQQPLQYIYANGKEPVGGSNNIVRNYGWFRGAIRDFLIEKRDKRRVDILSAVKKLVIASVVLDEEDSPQTIFESINATGRHLTEADKVRNYLFMTGESATQKENYKIWLDMEKKAGKVKIVKEKGKPDKFEPPDAGDFLRAFIIYKKEGTVNEKKIYSSFKEYYKKHEISSNRKQILEELSRFAGYYQAITKCNHEDETIKKYLQLIYDYKPTLTYMPYLLEAFHYNDPSLTPEHGDKALSDEALLEILKTIETYLARHLLCSIGEDGHIFEGLSIRKKCEETGKNYVNAFKAVFMEKKGDNRFPSDSDMGRMSYMKTDTLRTEVLKVIFQGFELHLRNKNVVEACALPKPHSVHHILPILPAKNKGKKTEKIQNNWSMKILGENALLLGNLTLVEDKLEDYLSFDEKKEKCFKDSEFLLNKDVKEQETWNKAAIETRTKALIKLAIEIWPYPKTE